MVDLLVMIRPAEEKAKELLLSAKYYGIPVWADYDDDLFNVCRDNPTSLIYASRFGVMKEIISLCDLITVSTPHLKEQWKELSKNIRVIPNALDPVLNKFYDPSEREKVVLWRGTATHTRDVLTVAKEIVEASHRFPSYKFVFFGADPAPWACSEKMHQPIVINPPSRIAPVAFYEIMTKLKPEVLICPLHDNVFNRSKSNIAAIEAALAGAATIAPNWEEWRIPGVTRYKDPDNFRSQLHKLMSGEADTAKLAGETWSHVSNQLSLGRVNQLRLNFAKELCRV